MENCSLPTLLVEALPCLWEQAWPLGQSSCASSPCKMEVSRGRKERKRSAETDGEGTGLEKGGAGRGLVQAAHAVTATTS